MSDSELSEFEPYDCLDDLAADLERYTQSQLNDEVNSGWHDRNSGSSDIDWRGPQIKGFSDERDLRGKIAIQIRPKNLTDGGIPISKSDLKKMPFRAPSIEERMAKFNSSLPSDLTIQNRSIVSDQSTPPVRGLSLTEEDDMEKIELNRKQRFKLVSDTLMATDKNEEISNNAARKSSFTSDNLGLHVVGQSRSGVHKNHESSLSDHKKDERFDVSRENVKPPSLRRTKMQSVDGGGGFPVRRKLSQGRKSLSPAVECQQQHSRFGTTELLEGGKQTQSWIKHEDDHVGHRTSGDQVVDRTKNLAYCSFSKKSDLRLASSGKVAAVIREGIQGRGSHSVAQRLTGVSTQLSREKVLSAKGGIYFPSQFARSQSFGEDHAIINNLTSGYLQRELKNNSTDAGKSPANEPSIQIERVNSGIYSPQQKQRPGIPNEECGVEVCAKNSVIKSRKNDRIVEDIVRNGGSKAQEQLRNDRSTHKLQRADNPGVIYASSKTHGSISQSTENNSIKSQTSASRVRKNSLGLLEPRKIVSSSGSDRGKLVEKNNNTVWNTDSASGSSEEERTIETDSSTTSSVIDERRRRRLVKRSKRRGLNTRKSQISQLLGREISAIESQTSDDGTSRASVDENLTDILSPDESIGKISSRESYKRARQIFEKNKAPEPQRIIQKNSFIGRAEEIKGLTEENVTAHSKLKEQRPPFTRTENHTAMSTVHTNRSTNVGIETRNAREALKQHRKNSGGTFSGVAKISKITIPSLQLRNFNATGRARYTSDTESYATHSKILSDPFGLGRRSFRDNNLGFSDGEHELTARLERNEEVFEDQAYDDHVLGLDRRCYTLPRNIGRKKMKESPFQLNLPGRKLREVIDVQCNSQSSIEDVSIKSFPLTMKDLSPGRIQSRSAGNIGFDPMTSYGTVPSHSYEQCSDNTPHINNSFENSHSAEMKSGTFTQEKDKDCTNSPASFSSADKKDAAPGVTSPMDTSVQSPFLVELLAPPDNFKDSPDEKVSEELIEGKVEEAVESSALIEKETTPFSLISHNIANETRKTSEKVRGRPPVIESDVAEKSHERAGSPRRRPSYVKAQFTDSILWTESGLANEEEEGGSKAEDNSAVMLVEETPPLVNLASDERETVDQKKKRSRPRIPPTLGPVKPIYDDILSATSPVDEPSTPGNVFHMYFFMCLWHHLLRFG